MPGTIDRVRFILWVTVNALALTVATWLLNGISLTAATDEDRVITMVVVALIFGVINAVIGTILRILTLPLTVLTLGLFSIVVNAIVLEITDAVTGDLSIDEFFWTAILAAIIMSIVSMVLDFVLGSFVRPRTAPA